MSSPLTLPNVICPLLNDTVVLILQCKCGSRDEPPHMAHDFNGQISDLVVFCSSNDSLRPDCLPVPSRSVHILLVSKSGLISVKGIIAWSSSCLNPMDNQFGHFHGFTPTDPHQFWSCSLDVHQKDHSSAWPIPMFAEDFEIQEHQTFWLRKRTGWKDHLATSRVPLDHIFETSFIQQTVQGAHCIGQSSNFKLDFGSAQGRTIQQLMEIMSDGILLNCGIHLCKDADEPLAPVAFTLLTSRTLIYLEATEISRWSNRKELHRYVGLTTEAWHLVIPRLIKAFGVGAAQADAKEFVLRNACCLKDFGQLVGFKPSCVDVLNPITQKQIRVGLE